MPGHPKARIEPLSFERKAVRASASVTKDRSVVHFAAQVDVTKVLHLTVSFDHDIIDGAPAARFVEELCREIEGGDCLEEGGEIPRGPGSGNPESCP